MRCRATTINKERGRAARIFVVQLADDASAAIAAFWDMPRNHRLFFSGWRNFRVRYRRLLLMQSVDNSGLSPSRRATSSGFVAAARKTDVPRAVGIEDVKGRKCKGRRCKGPMQCAPRRPGRTAAAQDCVSERTNDARRSGAKVFASRATLGPPVRVASKIKLCNIATVYMFSSWRIAAACRVSLLISHCRGADAAHARRFLRVSAFRGN